MPSEYLSEKMKYYNEYCIDENNNIIFTSECKQLYLHIQNKLLPKSKFYTLPKSSSNLSISSSPK